MGKVVHMPIFKAKTKYFLRFLLNQKNDYYSLSCLLDDGRADQKKRLHFVNFQCQRRSPLSLPAYRWQIGNNREEFVNMKMKQLSEIAATKKRRRRNGIGRGRWNLERVY